ncbi:MAG TPA: hypothetical protein VEI74_00215 [Candidatus Methylomirabilis sp.]|nr:hypothetical protein [Candidatus Methylomirabilis sp.]
MILDSRRHAPLRVSGADQFTNTVLAGRRWRRAPSEKQQRQRYFARFDCWHGACLTEFGRADVSDGGARITGGRVNGDPSHRTTASIRAGTASSEWALFI